MSSFQWHKQITYQKSYFLTRDDVAWVSAYARNVEDLLRDERADHDVNVVVLLVEREPEEGQKDVENNVEDPINASVLPRTLLLLELAFVLKPLLQRCLLLL